MTIVNTSNFYKLAKFIKQAPDHVKSEHLLSVISIKDNLDLEITTIQRSWDSLTREVRLTTKFKNPLQNLEQGSVSDGVVPDGVKNNSIGTIYKIISEISNMCSVLLSLDERLVKPSIMLISSESDLDTNGLPTSIDGIQKMRFEMDTNLVKVGDMINAIFDATMLRELIIRSMNNSFFMMSGFYEELVKRHTIDGIPIFADPITTDMGMLIYDNVDSHGELEKLSDPNKISAYSIQKAKIIADVIENSLLSQFLKDPSWLNELINSSYKVMWLHANHLHKTYSNRAKELADIMNVRLKKSYVDEMSFERMVSDISDLNFEDIKHNEKPGLSSPEERYLDKFRDETMEAIVDFLKLGTQYDMIINYVITRKAALHKYMRDENSFYVCKIGSGNPFLGDAPGALKIVPGTRPVVDLDEIMGSGFEDVKKFISHVEQSTKWHDLYVATSPSRTADKANVLLIGPQGCGKSEIMRAVGGDVDSIGVYAQGSDFLTCWKGEAEKNPKRLFEACVQLQKESGKRVHILIDEIDSVLNSDNDRNSFNLVTEFQMLMDGIVHYPSISVWGATNFPDRIPTPMIRRFSKVFIVGELTTEDRVQLLKHFMGFFPTSGFSEKDWVMAAEKLHGAVGDIVRKVCDHVWRETLDRFIKNNSDVASKLVQDLNQNGVKFQIKDFNKAKRESLNNKMRPFVSATPDDLMRSIDIHLDNVAIQREIMTAIMTYNQAKEFIKKARKS